MWIKAFNKRDSTAMQTRKSNRKNIYRQAHELQTSCPGGLIWYMQKLCSNKEHASGQKNNPWKQEISDQSRA